MNFPATIWQRSNVLYSVYLDRTKDYYCVEILGIKYGKLDFLKKVEKVGDKIIATSDVGRLEIEGDKVKYQNYELHLSVRLKEVKYTVAHDSRRQKLFGVYIYLKIKSLKKKYGYPGYLYKWQMVDNDYKYFRDNQTLDSTYTPEYLKDFYRYLEINGTK